MTVKDAETFYRKVRDVNNHTLSSLQRQLELAEYLDRWCPAYIMSDGNAARGLERRLKPMWALNRELMAQPMEAQRTRDRVQVVEESGNELYAYSVGLLALWNR